MTCRIELTPTALTALAKIPDRRIQLSIRDRIDHLADDPEQQGKPLGGELTGLRSLRAVGQRYRIIYHVERAKVLVLIVTLGLREAGDRKDVYELARKLVRARMV